MNELYSCSLNLFEQYSCTIILFKPRSTTHTYFLLTWYHFNCILRRKYEETMTQYEADAVSKPKHKTPPVTTTHRTHRTWTLCGVVYIYSIAKLINISKGEVIMSSERTYLETFIESIGTLPSERRRNLNHIRSLDETYE